MSQIKKPSDDFPRTQRSHIPRNISARALATSRKISNKQRKHFGFAKDIVVEIPRTEPKTEQDVFCRKLKALPLVKLGRRAKQCIRRLATANALLAKIAPGSKFRPALEQEATRQVYRLSWTVDEIKSRSKAKVAVEKAAAFALTPKEIKLLTGAAAATAAADAAARVVYES